MQDQLPDQFTSMPYAVGRVSGGPQILDGDHSSRVVTVGVVDYVCGDTKASAVHQPYSISVPTCLLLPTTVEVQPALRLLQLPLRNGEKFDYPSPSSAPGPSTSVSMATFTSSHSYLSTAIMSVPDPISMGDPMYYHPQYFTGIPPALGFPAQSLPDTGLFSIQVAFPWLLPLQVKGIVWSDFRRYANRASNSNFGSSQCYNNRHQLDLRPPARVQDNSAFDRSAANTYSYPMTQIPPQRQPSVYWLLPCRNLNTHRDFQQQHCSALEPADSGVDHTVKHTHTYSNIHRIFDLIDFRDCVVKWTRPKPPSA
ncbi:hypothetical protein B0H14DRAFT_3747132 [Mycena olivaceomarginata]|nr:hypothetical protein B0H14DRAFT_3747132 [Mycena olivaceomarginata]